MERLKEFRKKKELSQEAMAKKIGITLSMYEKVEQGRAGASAAFMRRFKRAFPESSIDCIFFSHIGNSVAISKKTHYREWLKQIRTDKGWTAAEVARKADISESYYNMIENGTRNAPVHTAKKIAEAMGFGWQQFFE